MEALSALIVAAVLTSTADVRTVAVDADTTWAGTTGGLVVMDGDDQRVLTPLDGLPDGTVRSILIEEDAVWIGTDRGLAQMSRTGRVVRTLGPTHRVHALARHDGALYVGALDGLYRVDGDGLRRLGTVDRVTGLGSTSDGLYVTTAGAFPHLYDGQTVRRLRGDRLTWDVAVDGRDAWLATSRGVRRYRAGRAMADRSARLSRSLPIADVRGIAVDDGHLVAGTFGGGLHQWDGTRWSALPDQLDASANVQAIARRGEGWLVATTDGLLVQTDAGFVRQLAGGLPENDITSLARTEEGLWVGTFNGGLANIQPDGMLRVYNEEHGLVDGRINRLAVDRDGDLWVATDRGVMERSGGHFSLRGLLDRHVFALGVAHGLVWAGAGRDLYVFRDGAFRVVDQPGERPQEIVDRAGSAVVATAEGLSLRGPAGWELLTTEEGLADDWVTAVAVDEGAIFLGTYNAGVERIDPDGTVTALHDDLWVNAGAMVFAGDFLAVGTLDDGLWLRSRGGWRTMRTGDGLPDDDVTAILDDRAGGLWVATRGGLARLRSES